MSWFLLGFLNSTKDRDYHPRALSLSLPFTLSLSLFLAVLILSLWPLHSLYRIFPPFSLPFLLFSDWCAKWIFSPVCRTHSVLLEWESILIFPWKTVSSHCLSFIFPVSAKRFYSISIFVIISVNSWPQKEKLFFLFNFSMCGFMHSGMQHRESSVVHG